MNTSSQSPLSKYSRSRGSTAFLMSSSLISGTWECHCCTAPFQQKCLYHGVELDGSLGSICRRAFGLSWVAVIVGIVGINLKREKKWTNRFLVHLKWFPHSFEMIAHSHPWQLDLIAQLAPASFSSPTWRVTKIITRKVEANTVNIVVVTVNIVVVLHYLGIYSLFELTNRLSTNSLYYRLQWPPWIEGILSLSQLLAPVKWDTLLEKWTLFSSKIQVAPGNKGPPASTQQQLLWKCSLEQYRVLQRSKYIIV